jgi:hypothetical protein
MPTYTTWVFKSFEPRHGGILKTCPLNDGLSTCLLNDGLSNKRGATYYVSGSEWDPYLLFHLANFVIEHVENK